MLGFNPLASAPLSALDANIVEASASASIVSTTTLAAVRIKEATASSSVGSGTTIAAKLVVRSEGYTDIRSLGFAGVPDLPIQTLSVQTLCSGVVGYLTRKGFDASGIMH